VIWRVIVPNMRQGVLNAMLLTALWCRRFTIAYLLLRTNLQVALFSVSRGTPNAGVLFSTSSALLFAFVPLPILSCVGRRSARQSEGQGEQVTGVEMSLRGRTGSTARSWRSTGWTDLAPGGWSLLGPSGCGKPRSGCSPSWRTPTAASSTSTAPT
jgi:ABC-type Fe3+ transport system permease subunit